MRSAVICVALLAALSADAFVVPARTVVPAPAARAVSPTVNVPCRINEPNMVIFWTIKTTIDSIITVATGKKLQGTGVWSWLKFEGSPAVRASIASAIVAAVVVASSPELVSALMTDSSINK